MRPFVSASLWLARSWKLRARTHFVRHDKEDSHQQLIGGEGTVRKLSDEHVQATERESFLVVVAPNQPTQKRGT